VGESGNHYKGDPGYDERVHTLGSVEVWCMSNCGLRIAESGTAEWREYGFDFGHSVVADGSRR
jgi:hypothetical protein